MALAAGESLKHIVSVLPASLLAIPPNRRMILKAFCSVSTGIYGYPIEDATHIALQEVRAFLDADGGEKVLIVPPSFRSTVHG